MDLKGKTAGIALVTAFFCSFCFLFCAPGMALAEGSSEGEYQILVLNSYGEWYNWTSSINDGIIRAFEEKNIRGDFYFEHMHVKRFSFQDLFEKYYDMLERKYSNTRFDVILSTDDDAFRFLSRYANGLFPSVPVVFCGVNDPSVIKNSSLDAAGFIEDLAIRETAEKALALHPETDRIILVSDGTTTGNILREQARRDLASLESSIDITDLHDLGKSALQRRLRALEAAPSVILFLGFYKGLDDENYSTEESLALIRDSSSWPVYSFWDFTLLDKPYSAIGGVVFAGEKIGYEAGMAAVSILEGSILPEGILALDPEEPEEMYSFPAARDFGLDTENLAGSGTLLYKPESFFERYAGFIAVNVLFFSVMAVLFAVLFYVSSRRKKIEKELQTEKEYWENLFRESPEAIVITDKKGLLRKVNKAFCHLFGFEEEKILGRSLDGMFARDRKQFEEAVSLTEKIEKADILEIETVRNDRKNRQISVSLMGVPLVDNRGERYNFWIYRDITQLKKAESELAYRLHFEEILSQISSRLVFIDNLNRTLEEAMEELGSFLGCSGIYLFSIARQEGRLSPIHETVMPDRKREDILSFYNLAISDWIPLFRIMRKEGYFFYDKDNTRQCLNNNVCKDSSIASFLALPLNFSNEKEGIILFENFKADNARKMTDITFLKAIADLLGETFSKFEKNSELERTARDLERSFTGALGTITRMLEIKDPYTCGHQERVTELAVAIAREMDLDEKRIEAIYYSSLVHDIGKISIPGEILAKPGKLTNVEFELIKNHAMYGWEILKNIKFPWPVAEIVYQHHEHIDGSGYPRGLRNNDILIEARIMAVADVVEAMSSDRPYRPSLGIERALEEISKYSERWFMPEVVEACLYLFSEKDFAFSSLEEIEVLLSERRV
jgi:PAS domain S-box-containing protein/putative nucleotidyltransferase with HDIG domain